MGFVEINRFGINVSALSNIEEFMKRTTDQLTSAQPERDTTAFPEQSEPLVLNGVIAERRERVRGVQNIVDDQQIVLFVTLDDERVITVDGLQHLICVLDDRKAHSHLLLFHSLIIAGFGGVSTLGRGRRPPGSLLI